MTISSKLRIFLSYSTKDKNFVGRLKKEVDEYPIDCFLAHENIAPSQMWEETIIDNLKNCNVFVPIITKDFHTSKWTDQECGMAVARGKFILPIFFDITPYGFLTRFQGLKLPKNNVYEKELAKNLIFALAEQKKLRNKIQELFIASLAQAEGYVQAGQYSEVLARLSPFTVRQMDNILLSAITNDQIYRSFVGMRNLRELVQ